MYSILKLMKIYFFYFNYEKFMIKLFCLFYVKINSFSINITIFYVIIFFYNLLFNWKKQLFFFDSEFKKKELILIWFFNDSY